MTSASRDFVRATRSPRHPLTCPRISIVTNTGLGSVEMPGIRCIRWLTSALTAPLARAISLKSSGVGWPCGTIRASNNANAIITDTYYLQFSGRTALCDRAGCLRELPVFVCFRTSLASLDTGAVGLKSREKRKAGFLRQTEMRLDNRIEPCGRPSPK
jgi:hypothetical protein